MAAVDPPMAVEANGEVSAEALAAATLAAAKSAEKALDAQLQALDINDERDLERIRKKRVEEMKNLKAKEQQWKAAGHGTYSEVADQKEWFEASKGSERVITHFYRPTTWRCDIVDKHFQQLSSKHLECRFIKIDAEKSPFLCERLSVVVMPTIIMTRNNFTHDRIEGFDELGGVDTFTTETMERRLAKNGMIDIEDEIEKEARNHLQAKKKPVNASKSSGGASIYRTSKPPQSELDSEEEFSE